MDKYVFVVVNLELGWDNIVGVFDETEITREQLEKSFPESEMYHIFKKKIEKDTSEYEF